MKVVQRFPIWLFLAAALHGCSADAGPAPEPTLSTPGALLAHRDPDGRYSLWQMLSEFSITAQDSLYYVKTFVPTASSIGEARELCRRPDLPVSASLVLMPPGNIEGAVVVWFRTLTDEDLKQVR